MELPLIPNTEDTTCLHGPSTRSHYAASAGAPTTISDVHRSSHTGAQGLDPRLYIECACAYTCLLYTEGVRSKDVIVGLAICWRL